MKALYLGEAKRKKLLNEFLIPASPTGGAPDKPLRKVQMLVVCDMLLTGFDAPILQALYLDKKLRDHWLLQTIARVNRPYNELKGHGLVLDYYGIFDHLNEALNYRPEELGDMAVPVRRIREHFRKTFQEMWDLFPRSHGTARRLARAFVTAMKILRDADGAEKQFDVRLPQPARAVRGAAAGRTAARLCAALRLADQAVHALPQEVLSRSRAGARGDGRGRGPHA